MKRLRRKFRAFTGFIVAGGIATALNFTVFLALYWVGFSYLLAATFGYVSGITVSFVINRKLVFRSRAPVKVEALRYVVAYGVALGAQLGLLEVFVWFGLDPIYANSIALLLVVILNFFVIRRLVFDQARETN